VFEFRYYVIDISYIDISYIDISYMDISYAYTKSSLNVTCQTSLRHL